MGARFCGDCGRQAEQEEHLGAAVLEEMDQFGTSADAGIILPPAPIAPQTGTPSVPTVPGLPQTGTPIVPTTAGGGQLGTPSVPGVPGAPQTGVPTLSSAPGGPQAGTPAVPNAPGGTQVGGVPGGAGNGGGAGSAGIGGGGPGSGGSQPGGGPGHGGGPASGGTSQALPAPEGTAPTWGQSPTLPGGGSLPHWPAGTPTSPDVPRLAPPAGRGQPPTPARKPLPKQRTGCLIGVLVLVLLLLILIPISIFAYLTAQASSRLQVHPGTVSQVCTGDAPLAPWSATLDNRANGATISWRVSLTQTDPSGQRWATISPTSGTIPAGKSVTLTITPAVSLCQDIAKALGPIRFTATLSYVKASLTLTDMVAPTPIVQFDATPVTTAQMCDDTQTLLPLTVSLDNRGSNVPVNWQLSLTDTDPTGKTWATATPTSGRVAGAQSAELTLTPVPTLCADLMKTLAPINYTAILTYTAPGKQDTITVTDTVAPPIVVNFQESPMDTSERCAVFQALPALPVTLDNTGSNVPVDWQISFTDTDPAGQVWATADQTGGTVAAQQMGTVTFTPIAGLCRHMLGSGTIKYSATITYTTARKSAQQIIVTDTIAPPAPVNNFQAYQTSFSQSCSGRSSVLDPLQVTLDNNNSTVPVTWQVTINPSGGSYTWASASQASGTIPAAQSATLTLRPLSTLCDVLFFRLAPITYSATVSNSALGQTSSVTMQDTVQSPPPTVNFGVNQTNFAQSCLVGNLPPFSVLLDNSASNTAVSWQTSITQTIFVSTPWAIATPSSGAVSEGNMATLTITPDLTFCRRVIDPSGMVNFFITITYIALGQTRQITVNDAVTVFTNGG